MSATDYVLGAADLAVVLAASGLAARLLVRRRLDHLVGATRLTAAALLATLGVVATHVLPAALGVLSREAVLAAVALWLLGAWRLSSTAPRTSSPAPAPQRPTDRTSWALAAVGLAGFGSGAVAALGRRLTDASTGIDMVNIHLPQVARWIQRGTLWDINQFVPGLAHGNYPNNGDVVLLAVVLPWRNDFLVPASMLPFLALTMLAVYALARELRAPGAAALLAATCVACVPIVAETAVLHALPDPVFTATFASGVLFLVRHARTGETSDLVLAGLGLGLAFGAKWYGVSATATVLVVWAVARLAGRCRAARLPADGGVLVGLIVACGGIWLVRNVVLSGNPVFPLRIAPFGVTIFDAPHDAIRDREGFAIAGYVDDPSVWWHQLLPTYWEFVSLPGALLVLAGPVAAAVVLTARRRRAGRAADEADGRRILALAACAAVLVVVYTITPYSAQGRLYLPVFAGPNTRYLVPALLVLAPLGAWLMGVVADRRLRLGVEVAALVAIAVGTRRAFPEVPASEIVLVAVALGALAGGVLAIRRLAARVPRTVQRIAVAACALVAAAGCVGAGYAVEERFNQHRYRDIDATFDVVQRDGSPPRRIALAGNWSQGVGPPFPMFGPRLRNEVEFAGPWQREMLRSYRDARSFAAAVRRGAYDLLVVGRGFLAAPGRPPALEIAEEGWARAAGLVQVAQSDTLTLYRARP